MYSHSVKLTALLRHRYRWEQSVSELGEATHLRVIRALLRYLEVNSHNVL